MTDEPPRAFIAAPGYPRPFPMLTTVFFDILGPILAIVVAGALLRRAFVLDIGTLSKINIYIFVPAFVFHNVATSSLAGKQMLAIVGLSVAQVVGLGVITLVLGVSLRVSRKTLAAVLLAVMFYNSGNFGLALAELAYGGEGGAAQTFVMLTQNVMTYTVGLALAAWIGSGELGSGLVKILRLPVIPTLFAALLARYYVAHVPSHQLPKLIGESTRYVSNGLVPVALLTLGAQLAANPRRPHLKRISFVAVLRLLLAPCLMIGLLYACRRLFPGAAPSGVTAHLLILTAGTPTAVATLLLTLELGGDADLAADCVFWTTVLSAVSVTGWLIFLKPAGM